jgi:Phosphatidylinositol-specific phospholipase C, X domain
VERVRRVLPTILVVLATLLLFVGLVTAYASRELFDAESFSNRAVSALDDEEVRGLIAVRVADGVVKRNPDLIGGRPLIEGAADGIVGSAPFQQLFRDALKDLHRTVFTSDRDTAALKLADIAVLLIEGLRQVAPEAAKSIPKDVEPRLVALSSADDQGILATIARTTEDVQWAAIVAPVLAALLLAGALALSRDRRITARRAGVAAAVAGVLGVVALEVGRALVAGRFEESSESAAARGLWDAFLGDLLIWCLVLAVCGVVVAAAAASLIKPVEIGPVVSRAWTVAATIPESTRWRVARAIALIVAGAIVIAAYDTILRLALIAAGIALIHLGVAEILRMTLPAEGKGAPARDRRPIRRRRAARIALVAAVVVGGVVGVAAVAAGSREEPLDIRSCNGAAGICDRPIDQVAFPSTHNSMSAADQEGWLFAQQERGIRSQLEAGIRGLLIDTHYGVQTDRGVYTVLQSGSKSREKLVDALGKQFVATAEQLRKRIGYTGGGEREVFLCHGYCETGSIPAVDALEWIRDYLVANPYEVVVISVEDDTAPEDTAQAFKDSGLLDLVWREPLDAENLPTPRAMIEARKRVVVMVEDDAGDIPWMTQQFDLVQETPFEFDSPKQLTTQRSCRLNRGVAENPMFLINNWVDTSPAPLPSNARQVNSYDALLRHARTCGRVRDLFPNLVAVDFYEEGDVTGVTDRLNRGG